ncbi:MAG: alpha-galactosidase [Psychrobacter alimentarius]
MRFGIWFEPEMVSEDSDLFRKHPDWVMEIPGRHAVILSHVFLGNDQSFKASNRRVV